MMGSATGELAAALTDATMSEQLTKSKKRRDRRKRKLLEQKQKLLPIDDTESQFDVEQKPFPFLDLPYGRITYPHLFMYRSWLKANDNHCRYSTYDIQALIRSTDMHRSSSQFLQASPRGLLDQVFRVSLPMGGSSSRTPTMER